MADIERTAQAVWTGDLKNGEGTVTTGSGVLREDAYSFGTRFASEEGTNPEELLGAAHVGCYCMAFAHYLSGQGHRPERIEGRATCSLTPLEPEGFRLSKVRLEITGTVEGMDDDAFAKAADEADDICVVSNALRGSVEIEIKARLA